MSHSERQASRPTDLLLITCEHGGNALPPGYARLFVGAGDVLDTHRGYDLGALSVALRLASQLAAPIVFSTTTRLLIDLNRSLHSPSLLSEWSVALRRTSGISWWIGSTAPTGESVTRLVSSAIRSGHRVVHAGIHSFTDVWQGEPRQIDLALLFDESRPDEVSFCGRWQEAMMRSASDLRYRFNEPYRGSDDGLTTSLRQHLTPESYLGLEVEIRQGLINSTEAQARIGDLLATSLSDALG